MLDAIKRVVDNDIVFQQEAFGSPLFKRSNVERAHRTTLAASALCLHRLMTLARYTARLLNDMQLRRLFTGGDVTWFFPALDTDVSQSLMVKQINPRRTKSSPNTFKPR